MLIRSVVIAMPSYTMSHFILPKSICGQIDSKLMHFWWGFKDNKKHNWTPKAWNVICTPKIYGGLGLRQMQFINKALVSKLGWNFISNPNKLWVKVLRAKYIKSRFL